MELKSTLKGKIFLAILGAVITSTIGTFALIIFINEKPNFKTTIIWYEVKEEKIQGIHVNLDIREDKNKEPRVTLRVENDGDKEDDNVRIQLRIKNKNNTINTDLKPIKVYTEQLEYNVMEKKGYFNCDKFSEMLNTFPCKSKVEYTIYLHAFIKSNKDCEENYKFSVMSASRNYSDNIKHVGTESESFLDYFSLVTC